MIPTSYTVALLLTIFTMLCWGSWANTFKLTRKWRFELFYFDYALGVLLAAIVLFFTVGSWGDIPAWDYVNPAAPVASLRSMAWALAGGVVFNLANMLLVAAISVAGLAVAFPVGIGLALVVGVLWNFIKEPKGNPYVLFAGVALVIAAIVVDSIAYRRHAASRAPSKGRSGGGLKGIVLSLACGLLMGSFYPLVANSMGQMPSLGPYPAGLLFAVGVFFSTFVFNIYFMNLPVEGEAVGFSWYLRGTLREHLLGILGGVIWCAGAIANFVASFARVNPDDPATTLVGPAVSYGMGQGATLISALWGLLVWKEFAGANPRVRRLLVVMLLLFVAGLALVAIAPTYGH